MSATTPLLQRCFRIGRFRLDVSAPRDGGTIVFEWSPRTPRKLTASEMRVYRHARDSVVAEIAELTGVDGAVAVVEI